MGRVIPDTLFIGATDLQSITGLNVEDLSAVLVDGPYRGDNVVLPGRPGSIPYVKVRGEYVMDIPVSIDGDDRADFLTTLDAVRSAVGADNLVTLTRRLTDPAGAPGDYIDSTCQAEYVAVTAIESLTGSNGRTVLQFINCDGGWTPVP